MKTIIELTKDKAVCVYCRAPLGPTPYQVEIKHNGKLIATGMCCSSYHVSDWLGRFPLDFTARMQKMELINNG